MTCCIFVLMDDETCQYEFVFFLLSCRAFLKLVQFIIPPYVKVFDHVTHTFGHKVISLVLDLGTKVIDQAEFLLQHGYNCTEEKLEEVEEWRKEEEEEEEGNLSNI